MVKKQRATNEDALITLDTIGNGAGVIEIDGARHDLLSMGTAGLRLRATLQRVLRRIEVLEAIEDPSAGDETEYTSRLRELAQLVLPTLTSEVLGKLGDGQLGDIATAFFVRAATASPRLAMAQKLTGTRSSLDSNGSTAATPQAGSTFR